MGCRFALADFEVTATGPLFDGTGPARVRKAARFGVAKLAQLGKDVAKNTLQPGHGVKTGLLRSAIRDTVLSEEQAQVAVDSPPVVYAAAIEFGWPPPNSIRGHFKGYGYMEAGRQAVQNADADAIVGPLIVEELNV